MADVLHTADPDETVEMPDGRIIRNFSAEEWADTLKDEDASPHPKIPEDVIADAIARIDARETKGGK